MNKAATRLTSPNSSNHNDSSLGFACFLLDVAFCPMLCGEHTHTHTYRARGGFTCWTVCSMKLIDLLCFYFVFFSLLLSCEINLFAQGARTNSGTEMVVFCFLAPSFHHMQSPCLFHWTTCQLNWDFQRCCTLCSSPSKHHHTESM